MRVAAVGQTEAGSGLRRMVGVCGEGVGAAGERGEGGFVGVESWGAAAAAGGAVKGGACEAGWISRYRAQRGRSGAQTPSVAAGDGGTGAASAAAPAAVCGVRCYLHSVHRCPAHHVGPLQQPRLCWRSEKGSAPACPRRTPLSSVLPGSAHADVKGGHGCSEPLPPPKPGTGVEAGAGWFGTETEPDVYSSQVSHQRFPSPLAVGR